MDLTFYNIFIHFVLEKTKLLYSIVLVDFSRLNFWTISDRYNHHQIVKNRYLHVDKLFWTKGLAIGDGSFFFPPFVCFSYSFEGSLRFFYVLFTFWYKSRTFSIWKKSFSIQDSLLETTRLLKHVFAVLKLENISNKRVGHLYFL